MPIEKAKDFKGTISKLVRYIGRYRFSVFAVIILSIGSTVFNILGPKKLGKAVNEIFYGLQNKIKGSGGIDFDAIKGILLILVLLYLISSILSFLQGWIMTTVSQKVCYRLRKQLSKKINRLPMSYFDKTTHGEVLSRITNDVDTLNQSLNQSITQLITSVTTIIGVLIMMLSINVPMTIITLLILPISALLMAFVVKKSQKYFKEQQEYLGHVNGQVEEVYGGHNVIRVFNKEESTIEEFDKNNKKLYNSAWKSQFFSGMMHPIMMFVGNLGYVVVAIVGGLFVLKGRIKVGDIQSFIQYVRNFTHPISQLAQVSSMLQSTAAAAERVFEFLAEDEEEQNVPEQAIIREKTVDENGKESYIARPVVASDIVGDVEFENVHFGYNPDKIIINDFSARVTKGQKIAIVGPTGAGKTTMVKLLMRFYDVTDGAIKLDGYDIRNFERTELRNVFGMVLQDTWLFKGSIMENIRYGRLDASDDEVIEAAKAAHAHHFIKTLPGGYNMELNEEASNVSQGQKQLLTIARAILANNKVLILDEATSSVDTRTEVRIQKAMNNLMEGRTSFIIAHRLSTIRDADLILVMKDGDIIEQGSHDELIKKNGFYADLYNSQFDKAS
ncbi:MAG: ABC transporter ATP-binding protein [Clostridiales bacterium]|nr:ABC transporter ATP-binding protein [Clostridiales bacterium]